MIFRRYSLTVRSVKLWNSLPNHIIGAKSVNSFKNGLDKFGKMRSYIMHI